MRHRWWMVLVVALQIAILLVMVGMKWSTLTYGTKVLLETRQVDPYDVFRGDYLTLSLDIGRLDLNKVEHQDQEFKQNETVYVSLQPDGRYWTARAVSRDQPSDRSVFIKGRVIYYLSGDPYLNVDYGIDSYYIPQGQGYRVDWQTPLEAEVSVDRWGGSALSRLLIGGQALEFE
ncbi:MAG: GDYXXLXY domain-containing protein [Firmicutes bacterium]|nr:GDYXXLXY domain-containing protein [Bacillota bacterium]